MSNIADTLLDIKEEIADGQSRLEQYKGQRKAVLKQFEELGLTPAEAKVKQKQLQKEMTKTDEEMETKVKAFAKKYPELEIEV